MIFDREEGFRAAFISLFLMAIVAAVVWTASAKLVHGAPSPEWGPVSPEVSAWAKAQHNSRGEWCCDTSDGHPYYGDYTVNADGSVTVESNHIPKEKVLSGPNPIGAAVWWRIDRIDGSRQTYCFALGGGM